VGFRTASFRQRFAVLADLEFAADPLRLLPHRTDIYVVFHQSLDVLEFYVQDIAAGTAEFKQVRSP